MTPATTDEARIPLWVDLRHVPVNKRLPYLKAVRQCRAEHVLIAEGDAYEEREHADPVVLTAAGELRHNDKAVGRRHTIAGKKGQDEAADDPGIVLVDAEEWTVIPLENLIAARRDRPGTLYALARSLDEVRLFRDTLEVGVHGIALAPQSPAEIEEADAYLRGRGPRADDSTAPAGAAGATGATGQTGISGAGSAAESGDAGGRRDTPDRTRPAVGPGGFLEPATVTGLDDGGTGDRICVDTTSLLRDGEGLLVGSTARSFALVHAETIETEYVRARPFRINAGAIHSYLYAPGGRTQYLSEVRAGDRVLVVHPDGVHRVCVVGRAKLEKRPHTLLRWQTERGEEGSAMLQTAETIRLVRPDGTPVSVTELQEGDVILVHNETDARHFGMPVQEHLEER